MPKRTVVAVAVAVGLAVAAPFAAAEPVLDYSLGATLEHSDNVNYSENDPVGQTMLTPRLSFTLTQKGSVIDASAAGTLEYRDYLGGAFGNEFRTTAAGLATWHISPERLDWVFEDNISRQPIDTLRSDAPNNQQQTNVFSTGPTLRAKFSDVLRGQFDLRYTNSYADTSKDFNSNRLGALGSLLYQLDPADTLSGSATVSRVRYTDSDSEAFDYDRKDVYLGYQRLTRVLTLELAAGYSWLDPRRSDTQSGALLRGTARWTPSKETNLGVTLAREYSDAAQDLVFTPSQIGNVGIGSGISGAVIAPQVYIQKRVTFDLNHVEDTFRVSFAPFWRKLDYVDTASANQNARGYYADFAYYLRPSFWIGVFAGQERRKYSSIERTDDDLAYGGSLNLQRTPHWLWSLQARHQRRDSDAPDASYDENAVLLSVTYRR